MKRRAVDIERDYERLLAVHRGSWHINFPGQEFSESAFRSSLRSAAQHDEIYVYEHEDELVGWLWLDTHTAQESGHIRHIQVVRDYWGEGYGKRIMWDAIATCMERGCRAVTLNVTKSNARAMALYSALKFVVEEDFGERQRMRLDMPRTA